MEKGKKKKKNFLQMDTPYYSGWVSKSSYKMTVDLLSYGRDNVNNWF